MLLLLHSLTFQQKSREREKGTLASSLVFFARVFSFKIKRRGLGCCSQKKNVHFPLAPQSMLWLFLLPGQPQCCTNFLDCRVLIIAFSVFLHYSLLFSFIHDSSTRDLTHLKRRFCSNSRPKKISSLGLDLLELVCALVHTKRGLR